MAVKNRIPWTILPADIAGATSWQEQSKTLSLTTGEKKSMDNPVYYEIAHKPD